MLHFPHAALDAFRAVLATRERALITCIHSLPLLA
jgi:hypothetical protein